jgi:hypothetical protein
VLTANPVARPVAGRAARREAATSTLSDLKRMVRELALEPVDEDSDAFAAALVLLAGLPTARCGSCR